MKRILMMCMALCTVLTGMSQDEPADKKDKKTDTVKIGGMTIIRTPGADKKREFKITDRRQSKPSKLKTNWWIVDLGFANLDDKTDYSSMAAQQYAPGSNDSWFDLKNGKSVNVNFWFFMQRLNMIEQVVNLQYGLGLELNNYRYKQPIRYDDNPPALSNPPIVALDNTPNRTYSKNKLAADYITVPMMVNFNFTPRRNNGFGFSAGVSAGYLYSARNKTINSDEGKKKAKDDFGLERWKLSYIGELSLGPVKLYGSYATKSMYKRGLDMTPYAVGLRFSNW
jgi:hypothetical protein